MGKQMEGDNQQRRSRAAEARERGHDPSEEGVTTGASNQNRSLDASADHEERITSPGWGKQQPDRTAADPRPGSTPTAGTPEPLPETMPRKSDSPRPARGELDEDDERVLEAIARLESDSGDAPTAGTISRDAGLPLNQAVLALQRLIDDHDVVHELPPDPDLGRRYRVKAR